VRNQGVAHPGIELEVEARRSVPLKDGARQVLGEAGTGKRAPSVLLRSLVLFQP
jgi:hypothetical protein